MAQRISNIYKLVTIPAFYSAFQNMLGARKARQRLADEHYRIPPGARVLDVGCGPADLLDILPACSYTGVDLNPEHVAAARARYGDRGTFVCSDVANLTADQAGSFDRIIFSGLLHHLDDDIAVGLLQTCKVLLARDGVLVGHEPEYVDGQHPIAKLMKDRDSGQNIRNKDAYLKLFAPLGGQLTVTHHNDLIRIPYNHIVFSWSDHQAPEQSRDPEA